MVDDAGVIHMNTGHWTRFRSIKGDGFESYSFRRPITPDDTPAVIASEVEEIRQNADRITTFGPLQRSDCITTFNLDDVAVAAHLHLLFDPLIPAGLE